MNEKRLMTDDIVMKVRIESVGWAYAEFCAMLDKGVDPRTFEVPKIIDRLKEDFD